MDVREVIQSISNRSHETPCAPCCTAVAVWMLRSVAFPVRSPYCTRARISLTSPLPLSFRILRGMAAGACDSIVFSIYHMQQAGRTSLHLAGEQLFMLWDIFVSVDGCMHRCGRNVGRQSYDEQFCALFKWNLYDFKSLPSALLAANCAGHLEIQGSG